MLHLLMNCPETAAAIPAADVAEVVPLVALRPAPGAGSCFAGIMDYRGCALPVIDLGLLLGKAPCARLYSTRILILRGAGLSPQELLPQPLPATGSEDSAPRGLPWAAGVLAEGVSDTIDLKQEDFLPAAAPAGPRADARLAHTPHGTRSVFRAIELLALAREAAVR